MQLASASHDLTVHEARTSQNERLEHNIPEIESFLQLKSKLDGQPREELVLKRWYHLAQSYSGMQLKKVEEDRIIALAGLAQAVKEALVECGKGNPTRSTAYVAGLWLRDIHYGEPFARH